ncbi:hypothetical protein NHX12_025876 [Muraenolepis orangiensis]|uniref:G-protein coupled receptors family 1 profile domain-containing protein n=1 Tax=Muraenolepis orangiensis TaxID=630683 RepID=A0A9Q0IQ98_9TELE|nr:hypothetical protein NHX12_025876 [Muraenolepis orangiensis]
MLICAGFLIAWIPYAVVSVISAFGQPDTVPLALSVIPTLLAKSSAVYNPIIYQVMDLKNTCKQLSICPTLKSRFSTSRPSAVSGSMKETTAANDN